MKVLKKDERITAESILLKHLPKSFQVYGLLYAYNRNKPSCIQVIVDTWPDFKVIICRPDPENKQTSEWKNKIMFFSLDEQMLRKMLSEEDTIDWSTQFIIGGYDSSYTSMLKEVSSQRMVNFKHRACAHLLYLPDSSHLITQEFDSELKSRISPLQFSHAQLVNQTWKFGGDEKSYKKIISQINHFPSYCITDGQGQPVSWLLLHEDHAMGMLYTLPEHRQKGYASVLIYTMAQRLLAEGYPLFCYVEEGNMTPYKLFKSMGFIEDPAYRAIWVAFNT
ncbi:glycine N-acyltransferase-like protein 3 [Corythoichthys intestinalis]|uniref:glycine N-acyltransferase-like protein 3 n=1 Tax=Corythoichthys intestinalis TaxID=161448 RepID=UPI0025A68199|nr:glycine N-acyltransferase-like protein 3 [Corythoichthys intestinalis]XP_057704241.1 glycine N-acyltransferase-like protein 3 [Corythoichthys intestinalis]XP_057704242.1 glycine N-acyltransferase-like protein 3 [Corythoichthys intestinalis]XP_057704244.1 glycine N-acyltransferase-like protein 3 [Corythoichthys intestinalis]XP_061793843.1 glycine N-acyltransferase-like protein 3 [Nerophis lumbriciformis]